MRRLTLSLAALALAATAAAAEPRYRSFDHRGGYAPQRYERGRAYARPGPEAYGERPPAYAPPYAPRYPYAAAPGGVRSGPNGYMPAGPGGPYPGGASGGFSRGRFLPPAYWGGYIADPRAYRLRRPPNGYGWVAVGPNAYLLQRSTGLILDTAPLN